MFTRGRWPLRHLRLSYNEVRKAGAEAIAGEQEKRQAGKQGRRNQHLDAELFEVVVAEIDLRESGQGRRAHEGLHPGGADEFVVAELEVGQVRQVW